LQPNVMNSIRIKYAGMRLHVPIIDGRLHKMGTSSRSFLYPILSCLFNMQSELGS
jgi:hypothetical protein